VRLARHFFFSGLARKTRSGYHYGQKSFLDFCKSHNISTPLPATATDVCMWFAFLAARSLLYTTIDNYRWALHSLHTDLGLPSILDSNTQIQRTFDGIKRSQGAQALRPPRLPVTPAVIRALTPHLNLSVPPTHVARRNVGRVLRHAQARRTRLRERQSTAPAPHVRRTPPHLIFTHNLHPHYPRVQNGPNA
jgi:hypothetical protein